MHGDDDVYRRGEVAYFDDLQLLLFEGVFCYIAGQAGDAVAVDEHIHDSPGAFYFEVLLHG